MQMTNSIAQLCPYEGGSAVYTARSLLRIINDSIEYYDDIVCLQAGYYRTMNSTIGKDQHIKLLPNPTKDKVELYAVHPSDSPCSIEIYNSTGKLVYASLSDIGVLLKTIDVSSFAQGVYTVRVQQNENIYLDKLVIIK
jgi:hypothetical protein